MSEAIAFDTHRFIKHLTKNGFTEQQAEALANEQVTLLNSNLATKAEIAAIHGEIEALRLEIKAEIEKFRLATKTEIATIHNEIETLRLETKAEIALIHKDIEVIRKEIAVIRKDIEDGREESRNQWKAMETALNNQWEATEAAFANQRKATDAAFHNQWKATEMALANQWKATQAAFEIQRKNTEAAMEALKVELLKWMFGAMIAQGGLIVGLIVALISETP